MPVDLAAHPPGNLAVIVKGGEQVEKVGGGGGSDL